MSEQILGETFIKHIKSFWVGHNTGLRTSLT